MVVIPCKARGITCEARGITCEARGITAPATYPMARYRLTAGLTINPKCW